MLVDTHCHLQHERFAMEAPSMTPEALIAEAKLAGVETIVTIACERHEWEPALKLAEGQAGVFVGAGIHPYHAGEGGMITEAELLTLAKHPKVVGFGETGLDYFHGLERAPKAVQQESFHVHLAAAAKVASTGQALPVIIHSREAEEDTLAILREHPGVDFVLHCFTGSRAMAMAAVEMGGYVSFAGVVTFRKNQELRDIAADLPRDRVLAETDAPYLAPEPFRGKRCSPAMVAETAKVLAALGQNETAANARRLFPRLGGRIGA
jgi:TatD DNase family protein